MPGRRPDRCVVRCLLYPGRQPVTAAGSRRISGPWTLTSGCPTVPLAALAALVRPATGDLLSASIANGGTFLGALCFFWGARLLVAELAGAGPAGAVPGPGAATRGG